MNRMQARAFTLIELLIVITIIFVLSALIMPQLHHTRHDGGCRASCANNLKQIGTALNLYESVPAYNCFPIDSVTSPDAMRSLGILFRDYVGDPRVFSCDKHPTLDKLMALQPGSRNATAGNLNASMSGYGYDPGYSIDNGKTTVPHNSGDSLAITCADIKNGSTALNGLSMNHGGIGVNILLCSGSVEWTESRVHDCGRDDNNKPIIDPDIHTADVLTVPNLDSNVRP